MALFSVPINAVAVSAVQDLFGVLAGATYPIVLHEIRLMQKGLTAVETKEVVFKRLTATVTLNGTAATPVLHEPGSAVATATAKINATTVSTTSGTSTVIQGDAWNFINGYFYLPAPEDRLYFSPNTAFVLNLPTAPSASMTVSGNLVYEELGA
jgi:hypothetical protein